MHEATAKAFDAHSIGSDAVALATSSQVDGVESCSTGGHVEVQRRRKESDLGQ